VTSAEISTPESWAAATVRRRWSGALVREVRALKGDASSRRFWRVAIDSDKGVEVPSTAIAIDLGPDDLPLYARKLALLPEPLAEPPWLNLHRFLQKIGAAVPELYAADPDARMLLVEDVGELALFDAAIRGDAGDFYRLAADELLLLHVEGTRRLDAECLASRFAYDERLFRWELEQFAEYGIDTATPNARRNSITPELDDLAARLGRLPRIFSHRDYHGHNLFVQMSLNHLNEPRLRVIDFQDALMGPAAQDLAVLLTTRDASRIITPAIERRVLDYYYAALIRREAASMGFDDFMASYRLCVIQHALKMVGRFTFFEREGKSGYAVYIPYLLAQARRMLALESAFPNLRAALAA
jgi:N-acetylmuramate 1-kinase